MHSFEFWPCGKSGEVKIQNYALEWEAYINIYIVLSVESDMWFVKIGYWEVLTKSGNGLLTPFSDIILLRLMSSKGNGTYTLL